MRFFRTAFLTLLVAASLAAADVPRQAPRLTAKIMGGTSVNLESLRGKVVLVMFFLTTCSHCQTTARIINPIYEEYKARGVEFLGLTIDRDLSEVKLRDFQRRFQVTFPLAVSSNGERARFAEMSLMARSYVPHLFIVDQKGVIQGDHPGQDRKFYANQDEEIRAALDALL